MMNRPSHTRSPVRRSPRRSKDGFGSKLFLMKQTMPNDGAKPAKAPSDWTRTPSPADQNCQNPRNSNRNQRHTLVLSP